MDILTFDITYRSYLLNDRIFSSNAPSQQYIFTMRIDRINSAIILIRWSEIRNIRVLASNNEIVSTNRSTREPTVRMRTVDHRSSWTGEGQVYTWERWMRCISRNARRSRRQWRCPMVPAEKEKNENTNHSQSSRCLPIKSWSTSTSFQFDWHRWITN